MILRADGAMWLVGMGKGGPGCNEGGDSHLEDDTDHVNRPAAWIPPTSSPESALTHPGPKYCHKGRDGGFWYVYGQAISAQVSRDSLPFLLISLCLQMVAVIMTYRSGQYIANNCLHLQVIVILRADGANVTRRDGKRGPRVQWGRWQSSGGPYWQPCQ